MQKYSVKRLSIKKSMPLLNMVIIILIQMAMSDGRRMQQETHVQNNQTMLFTMHGSLIKNAIQANKMKYDAVGYPRSTLKMSTQFQKQSKSTSKTRTSATNMQAIEDKTDQQTKQQRKGQIIPAIVRDLSGKVYDTIVPNDPYNPKNNKRLYDYYAELKGLDTSKLDKDQPKTKYEYDVTLDDGKGALPFDFIMNPGKWDPLRSIKSTFNNKQESGQQSKSWWPIPDRCPEYAKMPNFDKNAYAGTWYQAFRDKRDPFQTGELGVSEYSIQADGTVGVKSYEWRLNRMAQQMNLKFNDVGDRIQDFAEQFTNYGRARVVPNANQEPVLKIKFGEFQPEANYEIVETDYNQFTIIYSCTMLFGNLFKAEYAYVLTRQPYELNDQPLRVIEERVRYVLNKKIPSYDQKNLIRVFQKRDFEFDQQ